MSEYQYYEFRSIDRPLTGQEQQEIGGWSSRTQPTSTGATFIYNYGDFPKDVKRVVEHYFDAMFYIANWGTKRLLFKFSKELIDIEAMQLYCTSDEISLVETGKSMLLEFSCSDEEGYGWIDGEGWLTSLIGIRNDILHGDYRSLYVAWLHGCSLYRDWEDFDPDEIEPPIPPGLQTVNGALKRFLEFLNLDQDILSVAIQESREQGGTPEVDVVRLLKHLPDSEKDDFLVRLAQGEPLLTVKLQKRLQELSTTPEQGMVNRSTRTVGMILHEAETRKQERLARARERREMIRLKKLAQLETEETTLWEDVSRHIAEKKPKAYDAAINILKDLHILAQHKDTQEEYEQHVRQILGKYKRLSSLKSKIMRAKLITEIAPQ